MQSSPAPTVPDRPKLGVDICDACGQPPTVVGTLRTNTETVGLCRYCEHHLERWDILTDELVAILADWYRASHDRGLSPNEVEDVVDLAVARLAANMARKVTA